MNTEIAKSAKECRDAAGEYLNKQRNDPRFSMMSDFKKAEETLSWSIFSMMTAGLFGGLEVAVVSGATLFEASSAFEVARRIFVGASRAGIAAGLAVAVGAISSYLIEVEVLTSQFNRDFPEFSLRQSKQWYEGVMPRYGKMMRECEDRAAQQIVWRMQYLNNTYYLVP
jgi:hypothetical protein